MKSYPTALLRVDAEPGKRTPVTPPRTPGAWVTTTLHASARGASIDDREEGRQKEERALVSKDKGQVKQGRLLPAPRHSPQHPAPRPS